MQEPDSGGERAHTVKSLFKGLPVLASKGSLERSVNSLCTDSRLVSPGSIFFALPGLTVDGNQFVAEAVGRGAVAVISEKPSRIALKATYLQVEGVVAVLAEVARRFYAHPEQALKLTGVTGTNGKTTVAMLYRYLMDAGDAPVGLLGTVEYVLGKRSLPASRTTPEAIELYNYLAQMRDAGCPRAVMEVSSHAISQGRVQDLPFQCAVFLNLSQDHLDYHGTMENYFAAKRQLFDGTLSTLAENVVINRDDPYGQRLLQDIPEGSRVLTFGFQGEADFKADDVELDDRGARFRLTTPTGEFAVSSPLLGHYNVSNVLAALAAAWVGGGDPDALIKRLADFQGVPGRMERVDAGQDFNVLVDYAHTDDALRNALDMLRPITRGRLLVVFGCGGDRDRTKRPLMTEAVLQRADESWATADNPRKESVQAIFEDMRTVLKGGEAMHFVEDRRWAINLALKAARTGDTVLIAGKGHETFQEFADSVVPFDDRRLARELLAQQSIP